MTQRSKSKKVEGVHVCVKLLDNDEKHALYLLNGLSYSIPVSSLCSEICQIEKDNYQLKGSKAEAIIEIEDGRSFPVECEIVSNSKFKYKACKVNIIY